MDHVPFAHHSPPTSQQSHASGSGGGGGGDMDLDVGFSFGMNMGMSVGTGQPSHSQSAPAAAMAFGVPELGVAYQFDPRAQSNVPLDFSAEELAIMDQICRQQGTHMMYVAGHHPVV